MPLSGPLLSRDYLTTLPFSRLTKLSKPMGALTRYITVIQEEGTLVKGAREEKTIARIEACRESSKPTIRIKPRFNYPPRAYKILER